MAALRACALLLMACLLGHGPAVAEEQPSGAQMMDDLMYGRGPIGGPFKLIDQTGKLRSDSEFRGTLMIVYFGYMFCLDICPADLVAITQALDALGPAAEGVQPIFITIDPERDTKVLAEYVSAFHRNFIGLTGSPEEIRRAANSYKAFYTKVQDAGTGEYTIDHEKANMPAPAALPARLARSVTRPQEAKRRDCRMAIEPKFDKKGWRH